MSDQYRRDELPDRARRRLLTGLAAGAAGLVTGQDAFARRHALTSDVVLPSPADSGIDHIVVLMMENRSFDHMLGWLPGANAQQAGLNFVDSAGVAQATFGLAQHPDYGYQGCGWADPAHGYNSGRTHYANGNMSGFLLTQPVGDQFPIGYFARNDVPFYGACADNWTICDNYFTGILSSTYPNRIYMHAGQTDRISNTDVICKLPTIWDSLIAADVPCRYYYSDLPVIGLWGAKYLLQHRIAHPLRQFIADFSGSNGAPPAVSFVDPYMAGEDFGVSWDDHPNADIRNGQAFLNYIYTILKNSPVWERTLFVINYDEWGGFFDHVAPPRGPVSDAEAALGNDGRLGIRTPCVLIGPRAKRGHVESQQFDPNSILNMISWRFGLAPLGVRGEFSGNMATALDFSSALNASAPTFDVPAGPFMLTTPYTVPDQHRARNAFGGNCTLIPPGSDAVENQRRDQAHNQELQALQAIARRYGAEV